MPIGGLGSGNMERLTKALAAKNRRVEDLDLAMFGSPLDPEQCVGRIEQGFDHLMFGVPSDSRDKQLPVLDRIAGVVEKIRG